MLEESPFIEVRRRQIHRESRLGLGEATVHVPVTHRAISPLVDIDIRLTEQFVDAVGPDHAALSLLREDRWPVQNLERLIEKSEGIAQ